MRAISSVSRQTQTFSVLDRTLAIETDSDEIMRYIDGAFRRLRVDPDRDSRPRDFASILYGLGTAPSISFNAAPVTFEHPTKVDSAFHAAFYGSAKLFRLSMRRSTDWHSVYAAALRIRDRAVLIAGASGIGKTTLTLELLRRGAQLYGDEFACIRKSDRFVVGFPRTFMIREETLSVIEQPPLRSTCERSAPREQAVAGRVWDHIDPAEVFGEDVFASPARLGAAILLSRDPERPPSAERLSSAVASTELVARFNRAFVEFTHFADIAGLFAGIPCYRLWIGEPRATADALLGVLT